MTAPDATLQSPTGQQAAEGPEMASDFRANLTWGRLRLTFPIQRTKNRHPLYAAFNRLLFQTLSLRTVFLALASAVYWPLGTIPYALKQTRRFGPRISRKTGKSLKQQFLEQLRIAFRRGLPVHSYYQYELFNDQNSEMANRLILPSIAQAALYPLINRDPSRNSLENKAEFQAICEAKDIRVPTCYWLDGVSLHSLPEADLMSKPVLGGHGEGIRKWSWDRDSWLSQDGIRCTGPELLDWLEAESKADPQILQQHVRNANSIADLGNGVLTTVRLITCLDEADKPEACQAIIRIPTTSAHIDNIGRQGTTGGIAAPVDIDDGVVGAARHVYRNSRRYAWHPRSRTPIKGRQIPHWADVKATALHAHACLFPELALIGWDIGVTDDGPVIIEGNWTPSLRSLQAACGKGLGGTRLGDLMTMHLDRAIRG